MKGRPIMRVFKTQYTKPLPPGATIFTPRSGKDKGIRFAKFTTKRGQSKTERLTKDKKGILVETKLWSIEFEDSIGIKRRLKAYTDKAATEALGRTIQNLLNCRATSTPLSAELQKSITQMPTAIRDELIRFGVLEARQKDVDKPLSEHITDYTSNLRKKERDERYVCEVGYTLNDIFEKCGFVTWSDISAARIRDYLDDLRDSGKGISKCRYNALLGCVKSFARWMVRQQNALSSPVEYLDGMDNPQTDKRHPRRVLDLNELRRFLEAARTSKETIFGLSGYERNLLYRLAIETGMRSVDLRRLRVKDINFAERKIMIKAARIKNRTDADVFLKPATAAELRQYCKNKLPSAAVIYVTDKTVEQVKHDLANAGIPYEKKGEYFDFHALRHQTASLLAMNPDTSETVRQAAMRHLTPAMTRKYSHAFEDEQREAIEALPDLLQPSRESQAAVLTGTDGKAEESKNPKSLQKACFPGGQHSTSWTTSDKQNDDSEVKPQLSPKNGGIVRIINPEV